jgi:DNA-binding cell septation regulator SpoVG
MQVEVLGFTKSTKNHVLASVKFRLIDDDDQSIIVDDTRVLRNKAGELWLAMPNRNVQHERGQEFLPQVVLSSGLRRAVEGAVLAAFERWTLPIVADRGQGGAR